ncbi:MAG: carboxypeptidase-like regulatory domain-containing protein, partial [Ignavibacteriaceae bacterium]
MKILSIKMTFFLIVLYALSIYGQGILKGTVTDSLTAHQLRGARIILTGTTLNAVSDINGEFNITGIPGGDYILHVSYLGYKEKKILVAIKSEETQMLNIELLPNIKNGTDLTGQAKSQAEDINLQINSNTIRNVISGKKLQNMPDENISTALSRLPGVSIMYQPVKLGIRGYEVDPFSPLQDDFSLEDDPVSRILIRGLDSKYSNITIDGIRISPTSAKDKSVDLGIFSQRGFENIELQKTITSDEDGDATAGAIEMLTGKAPYKRTIKVEMLGNYNRLDKSANQYDFTGRYGERFFDNLLGVQVDANADRKILSSEYMSRTQNSAFLWPSSLRGPRLSYTNAVREKNGATVLLDFDTPDGGSIRFNNILENANSDYFENRTDGTYGSSNSFMFSERKTEQRVFLSSIGGRNYLFDLEVDWNAAFSESRTNHPFYYSLIFLTPTSLANTIESPSNNYCKEKTASVDISKKYTISNEIGGEFKLGGKYRVNSRLYNEILHREGGATNGDARYRRLADDSLVAKDFSGTRFDGLLGQSMVPLSYFQDNPPAVRSLFDKYEIPLINEDALRLWRQLNYSPYYFNGGADINSYDFSESVFAGYVMHSLNFGQSAKFITGIRMENEHNKYSGYYFPDAIANRENLYNGIPLQTHTYNYDKITLLPSFQMILKPANFLTVCLAAYKTLIRPDAGTRIPKIFSSGNILDMGNPDLANANVWNYELQTQFYGNDIGQFSINAFYKNIDGLVQSTNGIQFFGSNTIDSLGIHWSSYPIQYPFSKNSSYLLYTNFNSQKPTRIWGFEVEHRASFRYLPGLLKNIVLNYNLTLLRSETWTLDVTQIETSQTLDVLSYKKQKLSDMPEFLANVNLGYDIDGFSIRISYFYQGEYSVDNYFEIPLNEN